MQTLFKYYNLFPAQPRSLISSPVKRSESRLETRERVSAWHWFRFVAASFAGACCHAPLIGCRHRLVVFLFLVGGNALVFAANFAFIAKLLNQSMSSNKCCNRWLSNMLRNTISLYAKRYWTDRERECEPRSLRLSWEGEREQRERVRGSWSGREGDRNRATYFNGNS